MASTYQRLSILCCLIAATRIAFLSSECFAVTDAPLDVSLRSQTLRESGEFKTAFTSQAWDASATAVIVCDMWDSHHCYRAVLRENQMVPRMDTLLSHLRERGVIIIHAPSSCVEAYADHPARKRVESIPSSPTPKNINAWCHSIPEEEAGVYPIDQTDGGEDDTPTEHAAWAASLEAKGLNPRAPWQKQHPGLTIDGDRDFISDRGDEVWSILQHHGIHHVILMGVHTNMCVLGRPFGLRQMAKNGMNVVLVRDLTDSMYNPRAWPYVSHREGTNRIISHIERFVCPTVTSDQFLGGEPFEFQPLKTQELDAK